MTNYNSFPSWRAYYGITIKFNDHQYSWSDDTRAQIKYLQTSTYLEGADWIVNRETFQKMANLLDNMGRPYLTSNVIGEKIQYRLLGNTIIVDQNMPNFGSSGNKSVVLANIAECYAVNVLQDMTVKHLTEKGFTEGYEEYAGYILADGKIYNNDALVVGSGGSTLSVKSKTK